jgi:zeaxanthin glucosyltransferase
LQIDALVVDNYDFYGEIIPIRLGMPYAVVSNALHFDYSGYTPLCVYDWAYENKPEVIKRNRQGVSKFTQMLIRSNAEFIAQAEKAGIKANWEDPSSLFSDRPWITQCPREFDFESSHWPDQFHYAGPFHDGNARSIQKAIAKKNGLSVAADLLEQAFGLTHNPISEADSNA